MNGNSEAHVAHPISMGSPMRRRASAYVQYTSASHITTRTRMRRLMAVFTAPLSIPKMARGGIALASVPGRPTGKAGRTGSRCRRRRGSRARQPGRLPQSSRADAVRRHSQRGGSAPLGGGGQVGNEIDAARRENGAFGAGQLVRPSQGNVGRGGGGGGGEAELLRQRLQRRRRVRARVARAREYDRAASRQQRA